MNYIWMNTQWELQTFIILEESMSVSCFFVDRKVYAILTLQLLITFGITCIFFFTPGAEEWLVVRLNHINL